MDVAGDVGLILHSSFLFDIYTLQEVSETKCSLLVCISLVIKEGLKDLQPVYEPAHTG